MQILSIEGIESNWEYTYSYRDPAVSIITDDPIKMITISYHNMVFYWGFSNHEDTGTRIALNHWVGILAGAHYHECSDEDDEWTIYWLDPKASVVVVGYDNVSATWNYVPIHAIPSQNPPISHKKEQYADGNLYDIRSNKYYPDEGRDNNTAFSQNGMTYYPIFTGYESVWVYWTAPGGYTPTVYTVKTSLIAWSNQIDSDTGENKSVTLSETETSVFPSGSGGCIKIEIPELMKEYGTGSGSTTYKIEGKTGVYTAYFKRLYLDVRVKDDVTSIYRGEKYSNLPIIFDKDLVGTNHVYYKDSSKEEFYIPCAVIYNHPTYGYTRCKAYRVTNGEYKAICNEDNP